MSVRKYKLAGQTLQFLVTRLLHTSSKQSDMSELKYDSEKFDTVTEGKATILFPKGNKVFYNPIQQFNRDLSVVGIRAWDQLYKEDREKFKHKPSRKRKRGKDNEDSVDVQNEVQNELTTTEPTSAQNEVLNEVSSGASSVGQPYIRIIEALSASGLRAIRYAKEIPHVRMVLANDFSASAVKSIQENSAFNETTGIVKPNEGDANVFMHAHKQKPAHVVDLDPYGSAAPFLDAGVQAVTEGGLLIVTCTDLAVLAGNNYPEKCFALYGGTNLYSDANHESALRLVLHMVANSAAKYGKAIEPLLSLSIDFYVRLFIRLKTSAAAVKENASKTLVTYHCVGCGSLATQSLGRVTKRPEKGSIKYSYGIGPPVSHNCEHCGSPHHIGGPMWGHSIHNKVFIDKMLDITKTLDPNVYGTLPRMEGMLTMAKNELDLPFYFSLPDICSVLKAPVPPFKKFASAIINAGYKLSGTHAKPACIKTDAPYSVVWDIVREWIKIEKKGNISNLKSGSPGAKIAATLETSTPISFNDHPRAVELEEQRKQKILRFQENPAPNWGPKAKAAKN